MEDGEAFMTGTGLSIFATVITIATLIKSGDLEKIGLGKSQAELRATPPCRLSEPTRQPDGSERLTCLGSSHREVAFVFANGKLTRIEVGLMEPLEAQILAQELSRRFPEDIVPGETKPGRSWGQGRYEIRVGPENRLALFYQEPTKGLKP